MTNIDGVLLSAQSALAREASHGPVLMRSDAQELHDMIQTYRMVSMEREQRAALKFRIAEAERGIAAFEAAIPASVPRHHAHAAATLARLASPDVDVLGGHGKHHDAVAARVAITTLFCLGVRWSIRPSFPEATAALRSGNHSNVITRLRQAHKYMGEGGPIHKLHWAAKVAELDMHEWNDVVESVRNR
jgi:hypothetical protein